jgi:hypothetical protein
VVLRIQLPRRLHQQQLHAGRDTKLGQPPHAHTLSQGVGRPRRAHARCCCCCLLLLLLLLLLR